MWADVRMRARAGRRGKQPVCGTRPLWPRRQLTTEHGGGGGRREVRSLASPLYFSIPPLFIISQVFQSVSPGVNSRHTNRLSRLEEK